MDTCCTTALPLDLPRWRCERDYAKTVSDAN